MTKRFAPYALMALSLAARAGDLTTVGSLTQPEFRRLAEDLGAVVSYKGVTPATALGAAGFDIGLEVTDTRIENPQAFSRAGASDRSHLVTPKVHVSKGLFGGFDIGAFVGGASEIGATVFGADLRYAVIEDSLTTPAIALRVSGSRASGLGNLDVNTAAVDVLASKRFAVLTPYAGGGAVRVQANPHVGALSDERFNKGRYFGGLNVNLLTANLAFEAERMGANTSLSAKVGIRF